MAILSQRSNFGWSCIYLKDCFWLAGKTIGIVTWQCPGYPWKQWKCRLKENCKLNLHRAQCRIESCKVVGVWIQWYTYFSIHDNTLASFNTSIGMWGTQLTITKLAVWTSVVCKINMFMIFFTFSIIPINY